VDLLNGERRIILKKQHKHPTIPAIHERERGFIGIIDSEETYMKLKAGRVSWKDTVEPKMTDVRIPKEVFYHLMALDMEDPMPPIQQFVTAIDKLFAESDYSGMTPQEWWETVRTGLIREFTVEEKE
jgi:hypothetical protein